jgi:hypothetical protein
MLGQRKEGDTHRDSSGDARKYSPGPHEFPVNHDDSCEEDNPGAIGMRERRQDRVSKHLCVTVCAVAVSNFPMSSQRVARPELLLLLATIVLMALAAAIFLTGPLSSKQAKPRPSLDLRVVDQNGRMRVDWDPANEAVLTAQGATLEAEDGGVLNRYPVEPRVLRSGGLDYIRRSEDVLLTLTLYHDGRPGIQSTVRRIAPVQLQTVRTAPPAPPARPVRGTTRTRRR